MDESDLLGVVAGLIAYGLAALLGAGPAVYVAYWLNKTLTKKTNEDELLKEGSRAIALELGTTMLCQAILIRHAIYAAMAVVRILFIEDLTGSELSSVLVRSIVCIAVIVTLALVSVHIAGFMFKKLTSKLDVEGAIRNRGNVAMAIFYSLALLAITLVLNEGMEDLSRSLIPFGRAGIVGIYEADR